MKRILSIVTIVAILSLMLATFAYADNNTDVPQWFRDMTSWRKAQVDQAEKAGEITKEQAETYKNQIDQMEKFHTENGLPDITGLGACGGGIYNNSFSGYVPEYGFSKGMMNRYPIK